MTQQTNIEDQTKPPILLLDGGLGTTLGEPPYSVSYNNSTPLWSSHLLISSPETLQSVHRSFARAGADILLSATYQASYEGFAKTPRLDANSGPGYSKDEATSYMRLAITLAAKASASVAKRSPPAVALSLGAYGAILIPSQEFSGFYPADMTDEHVLAAWHKHRLEVFKQDAVTWDQIEYVAFETVRPLTEIRGIRRAVFDVGKKWWISHVVPERAEESDIPAVVTAMLGSDKDLAIPWGIGINCTAVEKVDQVENMYRETIRERFPEMLGKLWFVLYPDGTRGEKYDSESMSWVKDDNSVLTEPWEDIVMRVVETARASGVWKGIIVGGCCKTLPKDIKMLRKCVDPLLNI
ncbi:MAG: hypothetical protein GOMPHAMPRED_003028 [Gomphillus americanus]|uniref:Hcy-binding domain-containing protein n=1 Tax=Gomphillus americanus TaxID=1940652 RepID=A0A8H3I9A7_9LECA|nr:MAG: hypothetical protein GOMPHAMPRED_003028 [Gomphillus americanus]